MKPLRGGALPPVIATLLAASCAGGPSGEAPLELRNLMKREVALPEPAPVASADGAVRARVAGRLVGAFEKTPDHFWFGTFDIGTSSPVECDVFDAAKDPAVTLVRLSEKLFEVAGRTRKVESREILAVDAGNTGPHPYLSFDWVAKIDGLSHQIKQKFATRGDRSIYCVHDESGYAVAFDRFFAGFVASLEVEEEAAVYSDVSVLSIAGHEVGYQAVRVTRDADGVYRTQTQGATLIPTASDEAIASDDQLVEFSRADGSVINTVQASSDGRDLTRLDLERKDGAWTVTGRMQGKDVSERFDGKLVSAVDENRRILRVAHGELGEQRYARWLGSLSPGKPLEHVISKTGASSVRISAGPLHVDVDVDERGAARGVMHMGRLEIGMERTYVDGSL